MGEYRNTTADVDADFLPWDGPLQRHGHPVLERNPTREWESGVVYNPAATRADDHIFLLYRAEDKTPEEDPEQCKYVSRIGLASSDDGVAFERVSDDPVFDINDGIHTEHKVRGVEDPRVTTIDRDGDTEHLMTYTAFDGEQARLYLARSPDLFNWDDVEYVTDGKAGAILDEPVNDVYWMYQGDRDIALYRSPDGYTWETYESPVLERRPDRFDAELVEPGPAPRLTDDGILLIYNCLDNDRQYHTGAALFDPDDPSRLLARTDTPILSPDPDGADQDRRHDHLDDVVFTEGLVRDDDMYRLYFGSGDEDIRVATAPAAD